ncbi:MAG: hypothetical protein V4489_00680 [Chlamydiota bacterium]
MHLVNTLCSNLTWMSEPHRKNILKDLKIEEEKRRNEVNDIVQKIAKNELEYKKKSSVEASSSWIPKVEKEDVVPWGALVAVCLFDKADAPVLQGVALTALGMVFGSVAVSYEVSEERIALKEEKKEFIKEKFEFDKSQLEWKRDLKEINHQMVRARLDAAEVREEYLKRVKDFNI